MSINVPVPELPARISEYGDLAFLVTVGNDRAAHVVSVRVSVDGDSSLTVNASRRARANIENGSVVTLVWPPGPDGRYSLIADGGADPPADPEAPVTIRPTGGVLHLLAQHP